MCSGIIYSYIRWARSEKVTKHWVISDKISLKFNSVEKENLFICILDKQSQYVTFLMIHYNSNYLYISKGNTYCPPKTIPEEIKNQHQGFEKY